MKLFTKRVSITALGAAIGLGFLNPLNAAEFRARPPADDYSLPILGTSWESGNPVARVTPSSAPAISIEVVKTTEPRWRLIRRSKDEEKVLVEIPKDLAVTLQNRSVLETFPIQGTPGLDAVFWEYEIGSGLRWDDLSTLHLALCILDRGVLIGSCQTVQVAETSVHFQLQSKPEDIWVYWKPDAMKPERATRSDVRFLLRDQDADGYTDLVAWRRTCGALRIAERKNWYGNSKGEPVCGGGFELIGDERLLMRFNPVMHKFDAPIKSGRLPIPNPDLWQNLPRAGF